MKKFVEDKEAEIGDCEPMDMLMQTLVKTRYPGIPPAVAACIVKPEEEPEEGAVELPVYHMEESTCNKALVTAIFPSSDPAFLKYNLKGTAAECTDDDYESVGDPDDEEELDFTQIAQIWHDMAKLKQDEAKLYDKLAAVALTMTQGDLLYSVEKTPRLTSQLPESVEEIYTCIGDPQKFRVALAAGECLINIYKYNRENIKGEFLEATAHHFEVQKKDVYELLHGDKYVKPAKKRETESSTEVPPAKQVKT